MWIFLPLTCLLFVTPTLGFFEGTCLRKEPSPGVLVLTPGRELIMTCKGHVTVDGLKVRNGSKPGGRDGSDVNGGNTENRSSGHAASPTAHAAPLTSVHRPSADQETEKEEWSDGSRGRRGENSSLQWKWTGRMVRKRDQDVKWSRGATLSLPSVTEADSGTFTCYHRDKEMFSLKVIVADPPEKPSLFCYKKSPSSKIRCESKPQGNVTIRPHCYLLLSKSPSPEMFLRFQCSYSSHSSRCFCVLDHNEDEMRSVHFAYLCVTSIAGNTTSNLLDFTPMGILKPDPPKNVSVRKIEGEETWMKVTWNLPSSWKSHDNFYDMIYQIKYRPAVSSFHFDQIHNIDGERSFLIKDAIPGEEYLIQVRTKEEYDGLWSDWSSAVRGCSWTADKWTATTISIADIESSGLDISTVDGNHVIIMTEDQQHDKPQETQFPPPPLPHCNTHICLLWGHPTVRASLLFLYCSYSDVYNGPYDVPGGVDSCSLDLGFLCAAAVGRFGRLHIQVRCRHSGGFCVSVVCRKIKASSPLCFFGVSQRNRFLSKVQRLSFVAARGALSQPLPSVPAAPEGQALVTFAPPSYRERPEDEHETQELCQNERAEHMNFNNTSYFLMRQEDRE